MVHSPILLSSQTDEIFILTPHRDLADTDQSALQAEVDSALAEFMASAARHIVIDCSRAPFFGRRSMAQQLQRLADAASDRRGQLALCGLSKKEGGSLTESPVTAAWRQFTSKEQACDVLGKSARSGVIAGKVVADTVDEASQESFPASDPPARGPVTAVGGTREERPTF